MASERQCGVWVRGSGCVSVRGHKGLHTSAYTASIDALTAENERLRRENAALTAERDALAARLAQANDQVREILSMVASTDVPAGMEAQALRDIRAAFSAALAAADCRQVAGGD